MSRRSRRNRRNRNKNRKQNNMTNTPNTPAGHIRRAMGFVRPPAKPVTEFARPKAQDFTVQFTGENDFPTVTISPIAHGKMLALVKECPIEISWMSSVTVTDAGDFIIDDVYVPLQECGPATTEISEDGDEAMMMELMEQGKLAEVNKLRCWGHSHVNMGVFASGTDDTQTQDFLNNLHEAGSDHFIRFIGNKRGELLCNVYLLDKGIILNNPDMNVRVDGRDWAEWAKGQIKDKVTRKVYVAPSYTGYAASRTAGVGGGSYYQPQGVQGYWMNGRFIEDDMDLIEDDKPSSGTPALYDDLMEADIYMGLAGADAADFIDAPTPITEYDLRDPSQIEADEFQSFPDPDSRMTDGDAYYDFATRGQ